jgi:hypothetical protein
MFMDYQPPISYFLYILYETFNQEVYMHYARFVLQVIFGFLILLPVAVSAEEQQENDKRFGPPVGWSSFVRGGAVYQFDTDLDDGGSYDAKRFSIQAGHGYSWDPRTSVSLAFGYSYDGYSFSQGAGIAAITPWEDIHSVSLGLPMRKGIGEDWSAFLIPSIRSTGENGSDFDETITGGALTGFAYRFGDRLTIGPGIGIFSELEDSATVFPVIIINWKITDNLSLETGGGLGATQGPGLTLNYQANKVWNFAIGGRYEKLRFRLDKDGAVRGGVGEDKSFPVFASCSYSFSPKTAVSFVGGVEFGGELELEDSDGNRIKKESSDPGGFLGFAFRIRL